MKDKPLSGGYGAAVAVAIVAVGSLASSLACMSAVRAYADSVYRRELRIQASLNADSCIEELPLLAAADPFIEGDIALPEFGCVLHVVAGPGGPYAAGASASLEGVSSSR
ncbi:MAG: hypothetical protein KGI69_01505 [Patescibacteria group bacterium]|nr:hypothetical protein [Patescibacteria group bacterium]